MDINKNIKYYNTMQTADKPMYIITHSHSHVYGIYYYTFGTFMWWYEYIIFIGNGHSTYLCAIKVIISIEPDTTIFILFSIRYYFIHFRRKSDQFLIYMFWYNYKLLYKGIFVYGNVI